MNRIAKKNDTKALRKLRIRSRIKGTTERPRLTVTISNSHVSAQIIDDTKDATLAHASTIGNTKVTGNMTTKAEMIGKEIAKKAQPRVARGLLRVQSQGGKQLGAHIDEHVVPAFRWSDEIDRHRARSCARAVVTRVANHDGQHGPRLHELHLNRVRGAWLGGGVSQ